MNDWLTWLLASDAPALPQPWLMRADLSLGWALVLALLGTLLGARLALQRRRWLAAALALWALLPGPLTPDHWLGLAFHAPSITTMVLCAWQLLRLLGPARWRAATPSLGLSGPWAHAWLLAGVLLGYALLLDTFALLPLPLYAWGFSPALLLGLLGWCLVPWVWCPAVPQRPGAWTWFAPLALLLFAATRLPTGNLWDALLDPWLWLWLQCLLLRQGFRRVACAAATRG